MLVEAVCKKPLFPSEAEIDHLFRVFELVGTPSKDLWPEGLECPDFSPKFPVFKPIDWDTVAKGSWWGFADQKDSKEVLVLVLRCAQVLLFAGTKLLGDLLKLDPSKRCSAADARRRLAEFSIQWGGESLDSLEESPMRSSAKRATIRALDMRLRDMRASVEQPRSELSRPGAFPPLWKQMVLVESSQRRVKSTSLCTFEPDTDLECHARAAGMDLMIRIATTMQISDFALHLAGTIFHEYLQKSSLWHLAFGLDDDTVRRMFSTEKIKQTLAEMSSLKAVASLKLAETLDEYSYEYYQRERTDMYERDCGFSKKRILSAEKEISQRLQFAFHTPTAAWFLRAAAFVGGNRVLSAPNVIGWACMFLDLSLLHPNSQAHPAPLRGQVALLLAIHASLQSLMPAAEAASTASELWAPVRRATCGENQREPARRCLEHMVYVVCPLREQLRLRGWHSVQQRHKHSAQIPFSSKCLPADLVEELLPIGE